jgi:hypothetical protein
MSPEIIILQVNLVQVEQEWNNINIYCGKQQEKA